MPLCGQESLYSGLSTALIVWALFLSLVSLFVTKKNGIVSSQVNIDLRSTRQGKVSEVRNPRDSWEIQSRWYLHPGDGK